MTAIRQYPQRSPTKLHRARPWRVGKTKFNLLKRHTASPIFVNIVLGHELSVLRRKAIKLKQCWLVIVCWSPNWRTNFSEILIWSIFVPRNPITTSVRRHPIRSDLHLLRYLIRLLYLRKVPRDLLIYSNYAAISKYATKHRHCYLVETENLNIFHHYNNNTSAGPRLNIKTVLSTYGDFHVKDKTAVRTSYL